MKKTVSLMPETYAFLVAIGSGRLSAWVEQAAEALAIKSPAKAPERIAQKTRAKTSV